MSKQVVRQERGLQTRQKILEKAIDLLCEQPIETLRVEDICKEAGASVGSFYHYFASKEDLVPAIYDNNEKELIKSWEQQRFEAPIDKVQHLVTMQLFKVADRGPMFATQFLQYHLSLCENKSMIKSDNFLYKAMISTVGELIEQMGAEVSSQLVADDILRAERGILFDWCMRNGSYNHIQVGLRALEMILQYYKLCNGPI